MEAYFNRAMARFRLDSYHQAIADLTVAVSLPGGNISQVYEARGLAYLQVGEQMLAKGDFSMAIELAPGSVSAWTNLGKAQTDLGDFEGAVRSFTRALDLSPNKTVLYHDRSVAFERLGTIELALNDMNRVML